MSKKSEAEDKTNETMIINQLSAAGFNGAQIESLFAVFAKK